MAKLELQCQALLPGMYGELSIVVQDVIVGELSNHGRVDGGFRRGISDSL